MAFLPSWRVEAGCHALALGLRDEAAQLAALAQKMMDETGENMWRSNLHRLNSALARADGNGEDAERHLYDALAVARQQGANLFELRAAIDLARLMQEQERTDEAIAILKPVSDSIAEGDCPDDQAKAKELLNGLIG